MPIPIPEQRRVRLRNFFKEKELWVLVGLGILFFSRPLFFGESFFERDLYLHFFLRKQLFADFFRMHIWPLWDPFLHGGQPYIAELSNSALYPTNVLYLIFPVVTAFNLNIVLHFLGCAVCAYLAARVVGLQPVSALISGIVFGYCGYTLSLGNLLGLLMAMPYIPLLLAFWHLYLSEKRKRWFWCTVIGGAFQVFAGAPETNILTMLLLLGWTCCYPYAAFPWRKRVLRWGLLTVSILGVASVQIFPTIEMILQSPRGEGMNFEAFSHWSLYPERLPELILPGFLGYPPDFSIPKEFYWWGAKLLHEPHPYMFSIYFGAVVFLLAALGFLFKHSSPALSSHIRIFFLVVFFLALLLASGRFLPLFDVIYELTPFLHLFRHPIKFLLIGVFPLALLAGYGAEIMFGSPSANTRLPDTMFAVVWSLMMVLLLLTAIFYVSDPFARSVQEFFFKQSSPLMSRGMRQLLLHTNVIWLLAALLFQARRVHQYQWQPWLLAAILFLDVAIAGKSVNSYVPREFFTVEPQSVGLLRQEIGNGRLYRFPSYPNDYHSKIALRQVDPNTTSPQPLPPPNPQTGIILNVPSKDPLWLYRWDLETLHHYLAALYRLPVIFHEDYTQLAQARMLSCQKLLVSLPWERRLPLLSAGGVSLILTSETINAPGIELIRQVPNRSNLPLYLYRNTRVMPPMAFVNDWRIMEADTDMLNRLQNPGFDPRTQVILQAPAEDSELATDIPSVKGDDCQPASITATHAAFSSETALVSNKCAGVLVFSDPLYPGWQVWVDGVTVPVWRANYAFSAVFLPAGEHRIERVYRPASLLLGLLGTLISLGLLLLMTWKEWGFIRNP